MDFLHHRLHSAIPDSHCLIYYLHTEHNLHVESYLQQIHAIHRIQPTIRDLHGTTYRHLVAITIRDNILQCLRIGLWIMVHTHGIPRHCNDHMVPHGYYRCCKWSQRLIRNIIQNGGKRRERLGKRAQEEGNQEVSKLFYHYDIQEMLKDRTDPAFHKRDYAKDIMSKAAQ